MSTWRIRVSDPYHGEMEDFDLSRRRILRVGYDAHNDVVVNTTRVPASFYQLKRKGSGWVLRLPHEIKPSLQGEFRVLKSWKSKLYHGEDLFIDRACSWKIGNIHFDLKPYERKALPDTEEGRDHQQARIWRDAIVYSLAFMLFVSGMAFLSSYFSGTKEVAKEEVKEVLVADLSKLEKKVEPEKPKPPEPPKPDQKGGGGGQKKSASKPAEGAKGARPKNVNAMGILAVTTAVADVGAVKLEAGGALVAMNTTQDVGFGLGSRGLGAGGPGAGSLVGVEGVSGSGYGGGIGDGVGQGKGSGVGLKRREIEVQGGLDPEVIRRVIQERISEIRYCYETELLEHPNLSGKILATWQIKGDGSVAIVETDSSEISRNILHGCVAKRIQDWKFPAPNGGTLVNVKYPFLFSKNGI